MDAGKSAFAHTYQHRFRQGFSSFVACVIGLASLCGFTDVAALQKWPVVAFPKFVKPFAIGEKLMVNGLPMRLQSFMSDATPLEVEEGFRQSLGRPLVENTVGNKRLLGRAHGGYYLTVQIEPFSYGSKGIVAVTDLKGMRDEREKWRDTNSRWLNRLPAGSMIASQMNSEEAGKSGSHLVVINDHSESLNRDAIKSLMRDDGFQFEREFTLNSKASSSMPHSLHSGVTLIFKGSGKEGMAVIARSSQGRTALVLNTVILNEIPR